jgi:serine/threonine protein kinase/Tol biopolymer transport system component
MSIAAGTRLGRYEISSQLGAGGMGEVYLAQDTHLRRPAALKILPAKFTESEDRLRRFEREASTVSALNHPNIITIHEIGHEDSVHFMAMEFVDGETLRARLSRTEISLREALDIAVQVAEALAAAHEAGIVHRDIKPENIMIRPDGYVKVLDFGLAKLTERQMILVDSQAPTIAKADTDPGTVMGTMQYMSPEQARGKEVDKRTDIWSLGCVLYEMIAHEPPFAGETTSDVIVSLLSQEPSPLSQQADDVPHELERIVRKALQKNKEERYQTVKDLVLDLKSLRRELDIEAELERSNSSSPSAAMRIARSGAHKTTWKHSSTARTSRLSAAQSTLGESLKSGSKLNRRAVVLGLAIIVVAAIAVFGLIKFFGRSTGGNLSAGIFQKFEMTKLTTNGNTRVAAISPDGKYVAYAMDEAGKQSLWVRQVAISSNVRLLPLADVDFYACAFSSDATFIYYAMGDRKGPPSIYRVPVLGGSQTKMFPDLRGPISLSPDGKHIALTYINQEYQEVVLSIANLDGSGERKIFSRKAPSYFDWTAWSPDGKSLACAVSDYSGNDPNVTIMEVQVADGAWKAIASHNWINTGQLLWLADKSGIVMVAKDKESPFDEIWLITYAEGNVRRVTNDLLDYQGVSLTEDSSLLVSVQLQRLSNIWLSKSDRDMSGTQITPGVGTYYDLTGTTDGKLLYASDASGGADIWEMQTDGTNQKQLTAGAGRNYAPDASPDGRYIVFHSNRSGTWQIWRMDRDGSNPKQLTNAATDSNWPQMSADSKWVVYQHPDSKSDTTLWKVSIDGGTPVQLTDKTSVRPVISPDGKLIACWQQSNEQKQGQGEDGVHVQISIIPFSGGPPVKTFNIAPSVASGWEAMLKWTADGRSLTYVDQRENTNNIWGQPLAGGPPTKLTNFHDNQIFAFDWLRDGRLVCSRGFRNGDAVLIKDAR